MIFLRKVLENNNAIMKMVILRVRTPEFLLKQEVKKDSAPKVSVMK